jgi:hypothetical protein
MAAGSSRAKGAPASWRWRRWAGTGDDASPGFCCWRCWCCRDGLASSSCGSGSCGGSESGGCLWESWGSEYRTTSRWPDCGFKSSRKKRGAVQSSWWSTVDGWSNVSAWLCW